MDLRVGIVTDQYPSSKDPDRGSFLLDLVNHLSIAGVNVTVINHRRNLLAMSLGCLINSPRLDVLDAQFIAPSGVIAALTPRAAPLVITVHRWDILEFPYRWPLARTATQVALNSAQGIITVSQPILFEVMKFVRPGSRVTRIPNAVDTQRFRPDVEAGPLKQQMGIPENHRVVLSVGQLIPRKGFQYLIQAIASIMRQHNQLSLVIAGRGPMYAGLQQLGHELGLGEKLKLPGLVEYTLLPSFYAMADVFAMPSLSEGHCVTILEAMSSGKPIVASDIAANAESVIHGRNGFLVRPTDSDDLGNALLPLLSDDSLRGKFARNSRERAITEFSWKTRVRRLIDFYQSVL